MAETGYECDVSVVVPVYRSEECVEELVRQTHDALGAAGRTYEIILVNDCSPDGSWAKIQEAASANERVKGVNLRCNSGQDNAIMAGLGLARGRFVIIMDDDLQHDPRDMDGLIRELEAGHDVCYARFPRKKQALWKNLGSWLNDKVANIVIGKSSEIYLSPYKVMRQEVAQELVHYDGPFPYVDGLIFRVTANITQVDIEHHDRFAGEGNYNLRKSVSVWMKVATGFSLAPLRLATFLGFTFSSLGLLLALCVIVRKLQSPQAPMGWASTVVAVLVLGGIQLACIGLIGEYVGRVFLHLNRKPQYVVAETIGVGKGKPEG